MILLSRLVMLIVVVVLLVFCMSNLQSVSVRLLHWESPQMPLFLILLFVFFFGFFLALFWQALRGVTVKRESRPERPRAKQRDEEREEEPKKEKRGWGFGRKKDETKLEVVPAAEEETPRPKAKEESGPADDNESK